ncbi:glycosyltransferase family 2 protein [Candidatus Aminicenantes bacterium AC-334-K16]|jgi:glycosyltransferase involved in cell wall biosynthesis|nr:glycosyltransferase family 2 protein [Candidatus Aminicenantes bacterium AC-334-K16]
MVKKTKSLLSIVVPVYNEEKSLQELHHEISRVCQEMGRPYEVIYVDDGSTDSSFYRLQEIQRQDHQVKIVRLRKNFGQTAALSAGFDYAQGEIIISLDADLQNDPQDFPRLLKKLEEGYDMVNGWRKKRQDPFLTRRLPSMVANWLISLITGVKLHDYGCTLKAFHRDVVQNIKLYGELHRFIPAIASHIGVRITEIPVNHRPRKYGHSKYSLWRFFKVILDLLTVKFLLSYSTRPLQIFGTFGLISGIIGGGIGLYLTYVRLIVKQGISNRPLLLLSILLIVIGIQFISIGLLAELLVRTYHESSEKKIYYVREVIGYKSSSSPE